jgi:hypothetical protein
VYVLQIIVWSRFLFLFAIVLSVLRFTASDYSFGIFKLFFVLVVNIAGMKSSPLEVKTTMNHYFLSFVIG